MCELNRKKSLQDSPVPHTSGHRCVSQSCPPHPLGKDSLYNGDSTSLPFLENATGHVLPVFPWVCHAYSLSAVGSSPGYLLGNLLPPELPGD